MHVFSRAHIASQILGVVGIAGAAIYTVRNGVDSLGYDVTSFRLIIPLSLPGRRVTISSPTSFSSDRAIGAWLKGNHL